MKEAMVKKFPPRKDEHNLKDIFRLLHEIKTDLKVVEGKNPYNHLFTQSLAIAIRKIEIAESRLGAECFIDGLLISETISALKDLDCNLTAFNVAIKKTANYGSPTFPPYELKITGQ